MARIPKRVKCSVCKKAWATLGLAVNLSSHVRNPAVNEKTRALFNHVFGSKKASKIRTTGDIDACFRDVARRYPHLMPGYKRGQKYDPKSAADMKSLGSPTDISRDPFPHTKVSDHYMRNPERRIM